jgi:hypothetical protein
MAAGALLLCAALDLAAQTTTPKPAPPKPAPQTRKPAPPPPVQLTTAVPEMKCPSVLGVGVTTKREFCDILSGRTPLEGLIITLPPHRGNLSLIFDLHNRHTYSDELMKAKRGFARYTAMIGALSMDNTLIQRAAIQTEFRVVADLFDRIGGARSGVSRRSRRPASSTSAWRSPRPRTRSACSARRSRSIASTAVRPTVRPDGRSRSSAT